LRYFARYTNLMILYSSLGHGCIFRVDFAGAPAPTGVQRFELLCFIDPMVCVEVHWQKQGLELPWDLLRYFVTQDFSYSASVIIPLHSRGGPAVTTANDSSVCCFVLLTRGWGRLETRPPVALGSSPELFAFTMSLAPPVHPFPIFLTDT